MRLLYFDNDNNLRWKDFHDEELPSYAVLSHTWVTDEEVTYADLILKTAEQKPGYRKIRFRGRQAARDDLQYFWVDTCCINKDSSAELSEAINSMFHWYEHASKCYVYLSDVSKSVDDTGQASWEAEFRASRWFTRGWTLQELLVPRRVEFFSAQCEPLGDKASLAMVIHEITKIPLVALRGRALETFSIEERKQWSEGRETRKVEDLAYCLLGVFGVFMSANYGEGKENAFRRLYEEVEKLPYTSTTFERHDNTIKAYAHDYTDNAYRPQQATNRISDHYYTIEENDAGAIKGAYASEGIAGYVRDRQAADTMPVYQYLNTNSGDHFYTTSREEGARAKGWRSGWIFEKVAFYTFQHRSANDGRDGLERFLSPNGEHFYTADREEQTNVQRGGFKGEGNIGFISVKGEEGTVPLYRWYWHRH